MRSANKKSKGRDTSIFLVVRPSIKCLPTSTWKLVNWLRVYFNSFIPLLMFITYCNKLRLPMLLYNNLEAFHTSEALRRIPKANGCSPQTFLKVA